MDLVQEGTANDLKVFQSLLASGHHPPSLQRRDEM